MGPLHDGFSYAHERFQGSPDALCAFKSEPSLACRGEAPWGREIEP